MTLETEAPTARTGADGPLGARHADAGPSDSPAARSSIVIGLINNMPDSALEGTEGQFSGLLREASGTLRVRLRLSSIPEVSRGPAARARIEARYWSLNDLLASPLDALIVTGTEPIAPRLRDEPYWQRLVELLDYTEAHTLSSVWSCLAAHAAVLHLDGIERRRLPEKRFGVYEHVVHAHPLTAGVSTPLPMPHSRWNDLPVDELRAADYTILSESTASGVDTFVKEGRSLRVFFQGHPEYEERTLLKEFQRDVGRFVSGQSTHFPNAPAGYFDVEARRLIEDFERRLRSGRLTDPLAAFPFKALAGSVVNTWNGPAVRLYSNWLHWIAGRKAALGRPTRPAIASPRGGEQ